GLRGLGNRYWARGRARRRARALERWAVADLPVRRLRGQGPAFQWGVPQLPDLSPRAAAELPAQERERAELVSPPGCPGIIVPPPALPSPGDAVAGARLPGLPEPELRRSWEQAQVVRRFRERRSPRREPQLRTLWAAFCRAGRVWPRRFCGEG